MTIEVRSLVGPENIDATDEGILFGLAIPYNRKTNIGDPEKSGFVEQIAPGACSKSLREADIVALMNHDSSRPLGRTSAGNLTLKNTTRGVEPELKPVDTSYARDLAALVRAGVIKGWSFGFEVIKDEWTDSEGREANEWTGTNRVIREMKLVEVSPVTFPAYDSTELASRSAILDAREERAKAAADETKNNDAEDDVEERGGNRPGNGKMPYGAVSYADPGYQSDGKKRYPVDTIKHVKAALAYISKKKNAARYSSGQLAKIKAKIKAAAKKFGVTVSEQNEAELAYEWRCYLKGYDPVVPETRDDGELEDRQDLSDGSVKRIVQIDVLLCEAIDALMACDLNMMPDGAQRAASLIASAHEHSSHIMHKENLSPSDGVGDYDDDDDDNDRADKTSAEERRENQPKPDGESTSAGNLISDDALRLAYMQAVSREVELGLLSVCYSRKVIQQWLIR